MKPHVYRQSTATCEVHGKQLYRSRDLARQAARELHDSGVREYLCDAATDGSYHIGHLPKAVRQGVRTRNEHYFGTSESDEELSTPFSTPADIDPAKPLTYKPSPLNIRPLNGHKPVPDNSIESLLKAAEESGLDSAVHLALRIRELVAELVKEIRVSAQERDLNSEIEELRRQLDGKLHELNGLRVEPVELAPGSQAAMRAWARDNGLDVPQRGSIPVAVREAYEKAIGGDR